MNSTSTRKCSEGDRFYHIHRKDQRKVQGCPVHLPLSPNSNDLSKYSTSSAPGTWHRNSPQSSWRFHQFACTHVCACTACVCVCECVAVYTFITCSFMESPSHQGAHLRPAQPSSFTLPLCSHTPLLNPWQSLFSISVILLCHKCCTIGIMWHKTFETGFYYSA